MKKITLSLFAIAASCSSMLSQVVLSEDFTSPFNVTAAGWGTLNLSTTIGSIPSWFQGVGNNIPAYSGGANDYYAAHFNNGGGTSDISNWLFTPPVMIENGAIFQFATVSLDLNLNAPDRMQVRFSTNNTTNITPAAPTSVGTYTNLMLDINPLYTLNTASAVANGSVNGYPNNWVVYTLTVTGVPVATLGRFAFRYFVENSGPNGANGTYVGVDGVRYIRPCGPTVASYTTCANFNTTLQALGGLSTTTYSWSNGANTSSIVVSPSVTTVYTLTPIANGVPCPNQVTATITTAAQLGVNIVASSTNVCSGATATLTANTSANNYLWNTMETTPSITIAPTTNGTYSVGVALGTFPNVCTGTTAININVIPNPTIGVSVLYGGSTPTLGVCPGDGFTLTATGASLYNFILEGTVFSSNPLALSVNSLAVPGTHTYVLLGQAANGCIDGGIASFSIHPTPTVVVTSASVICTNKTITLTASGASNYTWNATSSLTANPYTVSSGTSTGPKIFNVFARSAAGCTTTASKTVSVSACTGIENILGEVATISAFPNPFSNEIQVTGFNGRIVIYNALGQVVYSTTVVESHTVNTADFAKGIYTLKSFDAQGEEQKAFKLVKN